MVGPGLMSQWLKWSRRTEDHVRVLNVKNELEKLLSSDPVRLRDTSLQLLHFKGVDNKI